MQLTQRSNFEERRAQASPSIMWVNNDDGVQCGRSGWENKWIELNKAFESTLCCQFSRIIARYRWWHQKVNSISLSLTFAFCDSLDFVFVDDASRAHTKLFRRLFLHVLNCAIDKFLLILETSWAIVRRLQDHDLQTSKPVHGNIFNSLPAHLIFQCIFKAFFPRKRFGSKINIFMFHRGGEETIFP